MPDVAPVHVACLCAAWCSLCDDYRAVLESLAAEFDSTGVPVHWHWVDIPTIVVAGDTQVRFAGAVTPQRETLRHLLRTTGADAAADVGWPAAAPEVRALAAGLCQRPSDRPARSSKSA